MRTLNRTPQWSRWPEAIRLFLRGATARTGFRVAVVVVAILSTINQGDKILDGTVTAGTWIRVGMNFLVPFPVSSYGFLMACRRQNRGDSPDRD